MRVAKAITIAGEERKTLEKWARGRSTAARLILRARIVLAAADGKLNKDIAAELNTGMKTVCLWRNRFAKLGLVGIERDAPRGGRPPASAEVSAEIVRVTTTEKPHAATHWSTRTLAKHLKVSRSKVHRVWQANRLAPHRIKTFKLSNDPNFAEKVVDIVGLYLNPPEHALVLCVDEKSQIQALDRTQKGLPIHPGRLGTMTHDYKRHGTTTLFAALIVSDIKSGSSSSRRSMLPPTPRSICTWSPITMPRTSIPRCSVGSRTIRDFTCTSRQRAVRGSTSSSAGFARLPRSACAAALSAACAT
jgi:transposase